VTNFVALPGVKATVMATEFKTKPRTVIICLGSKTDYSWFKMNPRSQKRLVVAVTIVSQSGKVPP